MKNENAEIGISAMIIFIAILIASAVVSAVIVRSVDTIFSRPKSDAQQSVTTFNGMVNVLSIDISALGGTDEIHLVFDLPYIADDLHESDLSWVLMCSATGETRMQFDEGHFQLATTLDGDGLTATPLTEFISGEVYHIIFQLDICVLDDVEVVTLILMVDEGRTREIVLEIGNSPVVGQVLF
ncbi:MAG: hypothetical protein HOB52_03955 [Euryarchaeota archaeon]|mgnify:CR=1 FL=1|nr:hypothetical protein [Euryarchaeota archaeon]MBT6644935.1 hypothetical protein [Euryarchaeota archaeon]